jgi:hypothetical protein
MHPLVRGAAAAAVFTALGSLDRGPPEPAPSATPRADVRGIDGLPAPCEGGTLPEGPVCIRIPGENELAASLLGPSPPGPNRGGPVADRIPRRPERPADSAAYVYPTGGSSPPRILAGLDRPGVRLAVRPGEKVVLLSLEHQAGPAEVVFAGDLFGRTVVTAHVVNEGPRKRTYLLFHGGLDHTAPGAAQGAKLPAGAELGAARTEGSGGGLIDVYLEAREVREGTRLDGGSAPKPPAAGALDAADPKRLTDPAVGVPTDVRNVLPLRP